MRNMTTQPVVPVPVEGSLGPAMNALANDNQRAFVIALLNNGDDNHKRAALDAGYTGTDNALRVTGHRLYHDDGILAAIHEEAVRRLNAGKIMAVSTLLTLARGAQKDGDKLKAIDMILNRTGMHGMTEHKVTVNDISKTDAAMVERINTLAKELGIPIDLEKMLGRNNPALPKPTEVVDAEFTVVEVPSNAGIEDLL